MKPTCPACGFFVADAFRAWESWLWPFAVSLVLTGVYGFLGCRDLYWSDSAEFVLVARHVGIAHPSGYPLYTLLTAAVAQGPWPLPWALAWLSGLFAALAMGAVTRLLMNLGTGGLRAGLAGLSLGLLPSIVADATVPEVYTLHLLLGLLAFLALVDWFYRDAPGAWGRIWFFTGLGLANHLITVWFFLPLAAALFMQRARLRAVRPWLKSVLWLLPGLALYAYLPLRASMDPLFNQGDPSSLGRMLAHISGEIFRYRLFTLNASEITQQVALWWESLRGSFGLISLPFTFWGLVVLWRDVRIRPLLGLGGLWLGIGLLHVWNYYIPDKDGYYLLPHLLVGFVLLVGLRQAAVGLAARLLPRQTHRKRLADALLVGLLAFSLLLSPPLNRRENVSLRDVTTDLWRDLPPQTLLISQDLSLVWSTLYFQETGLLPPGGAVVSDYYLGFAWYQRLLARRYPDLRLPPSLSLLGGRFEALSREFTGPQLGRKRQEMSERLAAELIRANLPRRPVALWAVESDEEPGHYAGFPLQFRGLAYTVGPGSGAGAPGDAPGTDALSGCDFSPRYRIGKPRLRDERERRAADLYATACNRRGIRLVQAGRVSEALASFEGALEYDPDYAQAMKNKGLVLIRFLDRPQEGRRAWEDYLRRTGDGADPAVRDWLKQTEAK